MKAGYYHLSSHAGDEFLINNPAFVRINYVRDSAIVGLTQYLFDDFSVYGEFGLCVECRGRSGADRVQYGAQYSPMATGCLGRRSRRSTGIPARTMAGQPLDGSGRMAMAECQDEPHAPGGMQLLQGTVAAVGTGDTQENMLAAVSGTTSDGSDLKRETKKASPAEPATPPCRASAGRMSCCCSG